MSEKTTVVVGLGEIGKPLLDILSRKYRCVGVDLDPVTLDGPCSVMHICIPFQVSDFVGITAQYIAKYKPEVTVINSTVSPGTTRKIAELSGARVVYSPVRGKHVKMEKDMLFYKKFVGADDEESARMVLSHFAEAGFKTATFPSTVAGELAKLMETTWLGVLVGWAQEAERIAARYGATYQDLNAFIEEIAFLPHHIFPGVIGGHCVMPNIAILRSQLQSDFLDVIVKSNESKKAAEGESTVTGAKA